MDSMLTSLFTGVVIIAALFGLLYWRRADPRVAALAAVFFVTVAYTARAVMDWPGMDGYAMHVAVFAMTGFILAVVGLQRASGRATRLHWGPLVIVGFFVGLISVLSVLVHIAHNGLSPQMAGWLLPEPRSGAVVASTDFSGEVDRRFQEHDDEYARHLAQVEAQKERGWQVRQGFVSTPQAGEPTPFRVEIVDRDGHPVEGASIEGTFLRAGREELDTSFQLVPIGEGLYEAPVNLSNPGRWEMVMIIDREGDKHRVHAETSVDPS